MALEITILLLETGPLHSPPTSGAEPVTWGPPWPQSQKTQNHKTGPWKLGRLLYPTVFEFDDRIVGRQELLHMLLQYACYASCQTEVTTATM